MIVRIEGYEGSGKTRLLHWIRSEFEKEGFEVATNAIHEAHTIYIDEESVKDFLQKKEEEK